MDFEKYLNDNWHEQFHDKIRKAMTAAYNQALEDAANVVSDRQAVYDRELDVIINNILSLKK